MANLPHGDPQPPENAAPEPERNKKTESFKERFRKDFWFDSDFASQTKAAHTSAEDPSLLSREQLPKIDLDGISERVEVIREVEKLELDRETNLNTRATAVAGVAGLIVSVSGAVGKSVFETKSSGMREMGDPTWTGTGRNVTLVLFLGGLAFAAAAMAMAVLGVLRPKRGPRPKHFFTETLAHLWLRGHAVKLASANTDRLNLLYLDRSLRTLPEWHVRNRSKARWLRRAWVILSIGVGLIGFAGVLVLSHRAPEWPVLKSIGVVFAGLLAVWLLLTKDWVYAEQRPRADVSEGRQQPAQDVPPTDDDAATNREIDEIAKALDPRGD